MGKNKEEFMKDREQEMTEIETEFRNHSMRTTDKNATGRKLIVLSKWLKDYSNNCYDINEGVVECQVRVGIDTALNKIGDYLDEIMFMGNEQIDEELVTNHRVITQHSPRKN